MQYLFHKFYLKPVVRCNKRFGTVLTIFKDSYRALRITSMTLTPPLLTVLTRKTDHVCVPGVDDMTVVPAQGSGLKGSEVQGSAPPLAAERPAKSKKLLMNIERSVC
jgi:hypothetical protein